jgi:hypothetical protein
MQRVRALTDVSVFKIGLCLISRAGKSEKFGPVLDLTDYRVNQACCDTMPVNLGETE